MGCQLGVEQAVKLRRVVEGVAAAERRLLRQLGEAEEALGPAAVSKPPPAGRDGKPVHARRDHARTERLWQRLVPRPEKAGQMLAVAAEQLVGAHSGQQNLDAGVAGGLAHQHGVDRGRIADRLVEHIDDPREQVHDVGADLDLVQPDAQVRGHLAGIDRVVGHRLETLILRTERDGVGLDGGVAARGHRRDEARVQPAAQEGGHRHVGHHVRRDRLLEHRLEIRCWTGCGGQRFRGGVPVASGAAGAVGPPLGPGSGRELEDLLDGALFLRQEVEQGGRDERTRVDAELRPDRRHQCLELGGEHDAACRAA